MQTFQSQSFCPTLSIKSVSFFLKFEALKVVIWTRCPNACETSCFIRPLLEINPLISINNSKIPHLRWIGVRQFSQYERERVNFTFLICGHLSEQEVKSFFKSVFRACPSSKLTLAVEECDDEWMCECDHFMLEFWKLIEIQQLPCWLIPPSLLFNYIYLEHRSIWLYFEMWSAKILPLWKANFWVKCLPSFVELNCLRLKSQFKFTLLWDWDAWDSNFWDSNFWDWIVESPFLHAIGKHFNSADCCCSLNLKWKATKQSWWTSPTFYE